MATCTKCGNDVTGKKFCSDCGTPVAAPVCPQCQGEVNPGAAFCMHCGASLSSTTPPPPPAIRSCPACQTHVPVASAFCTSCGHNMQSSSSGQYPPYTQHPSQPQYQPSQQQPQYQSSQNQYQQQPQYQLSQNQYQQQPQYQPSQNQYQQQPQYQPSQNQYQQQPQYGQPGYQSQPMIGQAPMALRCPTCMAMAPMGAAYCNSCRTSLAGVVPVPAAPMAGQQGGIGGFLQGNGGKVAMGVLGGAAAVIGGEMLLNGVENVVENRVEGDMGYGNHHHHHHREYEDRNDGLLGGLGHLADDIGL